jgi:hypothetical protein
MEMKSLLKAQQFKFNKMTTEMIFPSFTSKYNKIKTFMALNQIAGMEQIKTKVCQNQINNL